MANIQSGSWFQRILGVMGVFRPVTSDAFRQAHFVQEVKGSEIDGVL